MIRGFPLASASVTPKHLLVSFSSSRTSTERVTRLWYVFFETAAQITRSGGSELGDPNERSLGADFVIFH